MGSLATGLCTPTSREFQGRGLGLPRSVSRAWHTVGGQQVDEKTDTPPELPRHRILVLQQKARGNSKPTATLPP